MWRSLVAHFVRDEGAAGSNPVIPIDIGRGVLGQFEGPFPYRFRSGRSGGDQRTLLADPHCKRVISSFKKLKFKPGLSVPVPAVGHGHMVFIEVSYACIAISKVLTPWRVGGGGFRIT